MGTAANNSSSDMRRLLPPSPNGAYSRCISTKDDFGLGYIFPFVTVRAQALHGRKEGVAGRVRYSAKVPKCQVLNARCPNTSFLRLAILP